MKTIIQKIIQRATLATITLTLLIGCQEHPQGNPTATKTKLRQETKKEQKRRKTIGIIKTATKPIRQKLSESEQITITVIDVNAGTEEKSLQKPETYHNNKLYFPLRDMGVIIGEERDKEGKK